MYCCGLGVVLCARSAELIVATTINVKKNLSIFGDVEYLRRFFTDGGFRLVSPCAYFAQQWLPEQHLAPQQSAAGEVAVAVSIKARAVIIVKRYFIEFLLLNSITSRSRVSEPTRTTIRRAAVEQEGGRTVMMNQRFRRQVFRRGQAEKQRRSWKWR